MRNILEKSLINKSGIYMIVNLVNKKFYVGSATSNKLHIRFKAHLLYCIGSDIIAKAVEKSGLLNFAFVIIELYDKEINNKDKKSLWEIETEYLKRLNPPYNILRFAGTSFGLKHSDITKKYMKDNYSQERKDFIRNLNKGKIFPEEVREKMRQNAYKRSSMSLSTRKKCGLSASKPVTAYSIDGSVYRNEPSMTKLAVYLGVNPKTLRLAIRSGKLVKKKWLIKFDVIQ